MIKVFISVGMHGRDMEEVRREIEFAEDVIRSAYIDTKIEFVHNLDCVAPEGAGRLYCLGEAIKKMADCDVAYFVGDWRRHRGCRIENAVCKEYDITTFGIVLTPIIVELD